MRCTESGCTSQGKHEQYFIPEDNASMQTSQVWHCQLESHIWLQTHIWHIWSVANSSGKLSQPSQGCPSPFWEHDFIPTVLGGCWGTGQGPEEGYPDGWGPGYMSCVCRMRDMSGFSKMGQTWQPLTGGKHSRAKLSIISGHSQEQWSCVRAWCGV